ncbi:MAG: ATP-binding protein [Bacteroidota bacterium]
MIRRTLSDRIKEKIGLGKAILITGPRQVGKTTLIRQLIADEDVRFLDGDDPSIRAQLTYPNTEQIRTLIGNKKVVFVDEAQMVEGIGLTLKIIIDQFKDVQLWISGSSSFDLYDRTIEPLTGRKWAYQLYPISWEEFEQHVGYLKSEQQIERRLVYGFYPEVIKNQGYETEILNELTNSYLYKDVLAYADIRKPEILDNLVRALALQIGQEVNYSELSRLIGLDRNTIISYIDILEKAYVVFRLRSFGKNVRTEIRKARKIYFYDNGIRNAIINNFDPLDLRADKGALWENFLVSERIKQREYKLVLARSYFWRTTQQQEIDYIEEKAQKLSAFEFKWNPKKTKPISKTFTRAYEAQTATITRENFRNFVIMEKEQYA